MELSSSKLGRLVVEILFLSYLEVEMCLFYYPPIINERLKIRINTTKV